MAVCYHICLEELLGRLLTMKTDRIIGNLFRREIIISVEQIISGFGQPLSRYLQ